MAVFCLWWAQFWAQHGEWKGIKREAEPTEEFFNFKHLYLPISPVRAGILNGFKCMHISLMEATKMPTEEWLIGWRSIGNYLGRSAKTAERWARTGMPFFRDPAGRPIAKPDMIDEYILELNRCNYDDKVWTDEGIDTALSFELHRQKMRREFDEKLLEAQRRPRGLY
jgi:hypothetical protein